MSEQPDVAYFSKKLLLVLRDIHSYSSDELALELQRLANTAGSKLIFNLSASQAREATLREKLEAAEVKAKKILELEQRVKVLTEAVSMAERYLAERVSNSGTVGRAIVLPALRQALIPPLPKESKE